MEYRRVRISSGRYFFMGALADRKSDFCIDPHLSTEIMLKMKLANKSNRLLWLLTILLPFLASCSFLAPWKKHSQNEHNVWVAPDIRTISWGKSWSCWSATGSCSDYRLTDHHRKELHAWHPNMMDYFYRNYYQDGLFDAFVSHVLIYGNGTPESIERQLKNWPSRLKISPPPYTIYRISYNPEVLLMIESQKAISERANLYIYKAKGVYNETILQQWFKQYTPPEALKVEYLPNLNKPSHDEDFNDLINVPINDVVEYLVLAPNGHLDRDKPAPRLSKVFWHRSDKPDQSPQEIIFNNGKANIQLGNSDYIQFKLKGNLLNTIRTTEPLEEFE